MFCANMRLSIFSHPESILSSVQKAIACYVRLVPARASANRSRNTFRESFSRLKCISAVRQILADGGETLWSGCRKRPGLSVVSFGHVAHQQPRVAVGVVADQLWMALRHYAATALSAVDKR